MKTNQIKNANNDIRRRNALGSLAVLAAFLVTLNHLCISRADERTGGGGNAVLTAAPRPVGDRSAWPNTRRGSNSFVVGAVRGRDGRLYAASSLRLRGISGDPAEGNGGAVFSVDRSGEATVLHSFTKNGGGSPQGALLEARDGYLYGATYDGSRNNNGAIFRLRPDGSDFALLHEFRDADGARPLAGLVEARDGNLYGTTSTGGAHLRGTVYRLTPEGRFSVVHSFKMDDGSHPMAALFEGGDGSLYSATRMGGHKNRGVIYRLSADGQSFSVLHSFDGFDGANPEANLAGGPDGFLYGAASHGGANGGGVVFRLREDGSDFAVLHEFDKFDLENSIAHDGTRPTMTLISGDGFLYGTTRYGGESDQGVAFRMQLDGSGYTVLHSFRGYGPKQLMHDVDGRIVIPVRANDASRDSIELASIEQLKAKDGSLDTQDVSPQLQGATFLVTNTTDGGPGSLRQAIIDANNNPGKDRIDFFIFGSGVHKIAPAQALPEITDPVVIDGLTQPGSNNAAWPPVLRIEIDGFGTFQETGLAINTDECLIRGLAINRFNRGIGIAGNNNQVKCNFIGTDPTGIFDRGNSSEGIAVYGESNIIGGSTTGDRNLISGNDAGIALQHANGNLIVGNYIGTSVFGNARLGNEHNGIFINNSSDNQIGGTAEGARNVISGNGPTGFAIACGVLMVGELSTGNRLVNNFIGTNASGDAPVPNTFAGVKIGGFAGSSGVGATDNLVGGTAPGSRNVISGNVSFGVVTDNGNRVAGNYLGVDITGSSTLANGENGESGVGIAGADNQIGGTNPAARNVISGNSDGIRILGTASTGNVIEGNYIGTDASGSVAVGNTAVGILFRGGSPHANLIGGTTIQARNIISGNGIGISFGTPAESTAAFANLVQGNYIGLSATGSPLGNSLEGVFIRDAAHNNVIGGVAPGAGNIIANNGDGGVHVTRTPGEPIPTGNSILGNSIFSNYENGSNPYPGLGIDLNQVAAVGGDGVTQNDLGDADLGPNNLQNFPVLTQGPNQSLNCSLNSTSGRSFRVEFFANSGSDPSGYGEGEIFVGAQNISTDAAGNVTFAFTPTPIPGKPVITATATDNQTGDTSEFSFGVMMVTVEPPNLVCPPDIGVGTDLDQCSAVVNLHAYVFASGSSGPLTPICTPPSGSIFPKGTTTVSCTATNVAGSTSCSFPLTVYDTQPPNISTPANIVVPAADNLCSAVVTFTATAADNCPGVGVACVPPSNSSFAVGTTTVNCAATDSSGQTTNGSFSVIVNDTQAPTLICPQNILTTALAGASSAVVNYTVIATDNCSGVTLVSNPPSGSVFPVGTTVVTAVASDTSGRTTTCHFTVTVNNGDCNIISNASAVPSRLWPPDHKMKLVTIDYTVPDDIVLCTLSVSSNEPINGTGDGDTAPDWQVVDAHHVRLRAERAGIGTGRVYMVTITCTDSSGQSCTRTVEVDVRHNN